MELTAAQQANYDDARAAGFSTAAIDSFVANNGAQDLARWESALNPAQDPYFAGGGADFMGEDSLISYLDPSVAALDFLGSDVDSPAHDLILTGTVGLGAPPPAAAPAAKPQQLGVASGINVWVIVAIAVLALWLLSGENS